MAFCDSSIHGRLQLSRASSICRQLWKQNGVDNVGMLLVSHPSHVVKCTLGHREPRTASWKGSRELACFTLHVQPSAEAIGQYLSLPPCHRRQAGRWLVDHLMVAGKSLLYHIAHVFVGVCVQHDANLQPRDHLGLRDLLWDFPTECAKWESPIGEDDPIAVDMYWRLWYCASSERRPMPWCSGDGVGSDKWISGGSPLAVWLDSAVDFHRKAHARYCVKDLLAELGRHR